MNKTFELIWEAIVNPKEAFEKIREEKPVYAALIYLLLYGIVSVLAAHFSGSVGASQSNIGNLPEQLQPFMKGLTSSLKSITSSVPFLIIGLVAPYLNVFISVSIYELIAQFVTKRSNGIALFTAWSFASVPILIYKLLDLLFVSSINYTLPGWIELLFAVWGIVLYIIAIREIYQIDTGSAIGIYFTPVVALVALVILYVFLLIPLFSSIANFIPKGMLTP